MFTLGSQSYTQQDFAKYVADHQTKKGSGSPQAMAATMYQDWVNESALAYEEKMLDTNYPEFKSLMQEYRDGILLFELTDKKYGQRPLKILRG